jgi:hypothetical protein
MPGLRRDERVYSTCAKWDSGKLPFTQGSWLFWISRFSAFAGEAREFGWIWGTDQTGIRDAEVMWFGRRRQLLIHVKAHIKRWQTRAIEASMQIRRGKDGARIKEATLEHIVWIDQGG